MTALSPELLNLLVSVVIASRQNLVGTLSTRHRQRARGFRPLTLHFHRLLKQPILREYAIDNRGSMNIPSNCSNYLNLLRP
ncbi:hypothetical protein BDZ97DRAFT_1792151 [Flammula alnicola]|nr:hypothetical protein BDZ97DRAFT_1792151 [Flammula alnicola]